MACTLTRMVYSPPSHIILMDSEEIAHCSRGIRVNFSASILMCVEIIAWIFCIICLAIILLMVFVHYLHTSQGSTTGYAW